MKKGKQNMKQEKKLFYKIKREGQNILSNNKKAIFNELNIGVLKLNKADKKIENRLISEGNKFVTNKKERIYALIGIENQKKHLSDKLVTLEIRNEKKVFVPNVKSEILDDLKLKEKHNFAYFLKNPKVLAFASTFLVLEILASSYGIYKSVINNSVSMIGNISTGKTTIESNNGGAFADLGALNAPTKNPLPSSLSLLKVEVICPDASTTKVGPLFSYNVKDDGMVDANTLVKNETTSYIIKENNICSSTEADSFVIDVMKGSVETGYIASTNNSEVSNVKITITSQDQKYVKEYESRLSYLFYTFVSQYHAYVSYSFETSSASNILSEYIEKNTLTIDQEEKVGLIYNLYDYINTVIFNSKSAASLTEFSELVKILISDNKETIKNIISLLEKITSEGYSDGEEQEITNMLFKEYVDSYKLQLFKNRYKVLLNDDTKNNDIDSGEYFTPKKGQPHYDLYDIKMSEEEINLIDNINVLKDSITYFIYNCKIFNNKADLLAYFLDNIEYGFEFDDNKFAPDEGNRDNHNHGGNSQDDWDKEDEDEYYDWFDEYYGDNPFGY